eukprot:538396-Prymnesium_polylepis.1
MAASTAAGGCGAACVAVGTHDRLAPLMAVSAAAEGGGAACVAVGTHEYLAPLMAASRSCGWFLRLVPAA